MPEITPLGHHQFSSQDRLLFDTNIWIMLFDLRSEGRERINAGKVYRGAFHRALQAGAGIFCHAIVVGEYVNRMCRDEHVFQCARDQNTPGFKQWRKSTEALDYLNLVAGAVTNFAGLTDLLDRTPGGEDLERCLDWFREDQIDWTDSLLIWLCQQHDLTLVTDDADFGRIAGLNFQILTANSKLLRQ